MKIPETQPKKILELVNFIKVAGYKINIQKSELYFYTLMMNHLRKKEIYPIQNSIKNNKIGLLWWRSG